MRKKKRKEVEFFFSDWPPLFPLTVSPPARRDASASVVRYVIDEGPSQSGSDGGAAATAAASAASAAAAAAGAGALTPGDRAPASFASAAATGEGAGAAAAASAPPLSSSAMTRRLSRCYACSWGLLLLFFKNRARLSQQQLEKREKKVRIALSIDDTIHFAFRSGGIGYLFLSSFLALRLRSSSRAHVEAV